jgi:hypothetical protein
VVVVTDASKRPAVKRTTRPTYEVVVERDGKFWHFRTRNLERVFGQTRRLDQVESAFREVVSLVHGVPEDAFDVQIRTDLGGELTTIVDAACAERSEAVRRMARAQELTEQAVGRLLEAGLSMRDTGELVGVSFQRVAQLSKQRHKSAG